MFFLTLLLIPLSAFSKDCKDFTKSVLLSDSKNFELTAKERLETEISTHKVGNRQIAFTKQPSTCGARGCEGAIYLEQSNHCAKFLLSYSGQVSVADENDWSKIQVSLPVLAVDSAKKLVKSYGFDFQHENYLELK